MTLWHHGSQAMSAQDIIRFGLQHSKTTANMHERGNPQNQHSTEIACCYENKKLKIGGRPWRTAGS